MKLVFGFSLLLFLPFLAEAENNKIRLPFEVKQYIEKSNFNGAVLVSEGDNLVIEEYIGYADIKKSIELNETHLFSPGSVGKEFTTVGTIQLVEKGLLSYDDKISDYLSNLPAWATEVTIHQVLSHTSGFPKINWKRNIATTEALTQLSNSEPSFEPGNGYLYSNLNVIVRALIIETVTNMGFSAFLKKYVFAPSKMTHSYLQLLETDISNNKVVGDYPTFLNGVTIYVTPLDLINYESALSKSVLVPFSEVQSTLEGDSLSGQNGRALYDFGYFSVNEKNKLTTWTHDGSNPSHHTLKFHDFDNDIIILIMSNDGNKSSLFKIKESLMEHLLL